MDFLKTIDSLDYPFCILDSKSQIIFRNNEFVNIFSNENDDFISMVKPSNRNELRRKITHVKKPKNKHVRLNAKLGSKFTSMKLFGLSNERVFIFIDVLRSKRAIQQFMDEKQQILNKKSSFGAN